MILFIHHRYRVAGGEEHAVRGLAAVVREQLGEGVEVLERDSSKLGAAAAAAGLLGGGLRADQITHAVRHTGARIVHAHNVQPTFGWHALAQARAAGARVVLHLHQYRLVCAIGVGFRNGRECTECRGRNTLPGLRHNCRGGGHEALAYSAALALWQHRMLTEADAVVVPSAFARDRLLELGIPVSGAFVVPNPVTVPAEPPAGIHDRRGALVVSRLAPEKGIDVAIDACVRARLPLTIAGDGPLRAALEARAAAAGGSIRFLGEVTQRELAVLRAGAAVAVVPSRSAETFGLAAAEAMAAGLPVAASRIGALPELVPERWLAPPGDAIALAAVIEEALGTPEGSRLAWERVRGHAAPEVVARSLDAVYAAASSSPSPSQPSPSPSPS